MKHFNKYMGAVLTAGLLLVLATGCAGAAGPVDRIQLFKAMDNPGVPTAGSLADSQKDPKPDIVWEFSPEDKIFFGIRLNKDLEEDIVFTKYIFYNRDTSAESEVGLPEQLGPFEPGQITLVAFNDPWALPESAGSYEFRIYSGDSIVSRALFNISD